MQGKCKNGRKGTNCSFPHPNMCLRFIRSGNNCCNNGSSCQYAHPKLCKASLTSKRCDRQTCYYYHVAGTSHPLTDISPTHYNNESCDNNESVPVPRKFKPTPLMQMDVNHLSNSLPFMHNPISMLPQNVSQLPPKTKVSTPQVSVPQVPVPHVPVHLQRSNEPSIFLEPLNELNMQMNSYLIQSLIERAWLPLTGCALLGLPDPTAHNNFH